jgi:hypothetical protein
MPKKGDASLAGAVAEVNAWLTQNEKREVVSTDNPVLPAKYYTYVSFRGKPRFVRRTRLGILAGVPALTIHKRRLDPYGRLWRKGRIIEETRDANNDVVIKSELGPPAGRKDYEQLLPTGVEVLDRAGWHRAHSQGGGFGTESAHGIRLAPIEVNLVLQNLYLENRVRELVQEKAPGVRIFMTTVTETWPGTLRLKEIQYKLEAELPGKISRTHIWDAEINVTDSRDAPRASKSVTERSGWSMIDQFLAPAPRRMGTPTRRKRATKKK